MKWKYFFNPFEKYSEFVLLITGLVLFVAGALIGQWQNVSYDGFLDVHGYEGQSFGRAALENAVCIAVGFILLCSLGFIINKKTRVVDIFNTALLYRVPIYACALFANTAAINNIVNGITDKKNTAALNIPTMQLLLILLFACGLLLFLVYSIILLVNGFKTAANAQRWYHYVAFTVTVLIAEVISKQFINHYLM